MKNRFAMLAIMTICIGFSFGGDARATEATLIQVELSSGRTFTAAVDARSDDQTLWLRFETGAVRLWRPVKWTHVVRLEGPQGRLTKEQALELATVAPARRQRRQQPVASSIPLAQRADEVLDPQQRVCGIDFRAELGNWDADITPDGLVFELRLLDRWQRDVAAGGSVEVQWLVPRHRGSHSPALRNASPVQRLGRWTRQFSAEEIAEGISWRLPFQAWNPSFDTSWEAAGIVSVKVTIPGHGSFSDSRDFVRTRPASPTRDLNRQVSGTSYFAGERIGR